MGQNRTVRRVAPLLRRGQNPPAWEDTAELLNHVYTTRPMRRAFPGSELVLFVAEPSAPPAPSEVTDLAARRTGP